MRFVYYCNVGDMAPTNVKKYMDAQSTYVRESGFIEPEDKLLVIATRGESRIEVLNDSAIPSA